MVCGRAWVAEMENGRRVPGPANASDGACWTWLGPALRSL